MGGINDYLSGIKKQYPDTREVNEQIEELRDTLHLKTEEYQALGKTYGEAVAEAISSMGDLTPLLDQVSGNTRSAYVNRLNRDNALYCALIIMAEYLLGWLVYLLSTYESGRNLIGPFICYFLIIGVGMSVWPLVAHIAHRRQPDRAETVTMQYKKQMRVALIVWGGLSLFLFIINVIAMVNGSDIWFVWPVLGIANWPLNIWLYHRMLVSGKYDAE
jgi:uncharacterized integral membrane protein